MNNPLQDRIMKLAQTEINKKVSPLKGKVVSYSNIHNYAQVEINNPYGGGLMLLEYVPVQVVGGLHFPGPYPDDEVWVEFTAGNIALPKIVSVAERKYRDKFRERKLKHKKQGAYVPDALSKKV